MSAVWMRARNELRGRWRALVSLALIAGIGAGVAISAAAGARHTVSAYPRFRAATHAFDALVASTGDEPDAQQLAMLTPLERLPAIEDWSMTEGFTCAVTGPSGATEAFPDLFAIASSDGRIGYTLNRIKLQSGRLADPARADEAMLTSFAAQRLGAKVGSTLTLNFPQNQRLVKVVGVGIMAGAVDPAAGAYIPLLLMTPAFYEQNAAPEQRNGPTLVVRTRGGGIAELQKELAQSSEGVSVLVSALPQDASVRRTALFQTVGLAAFGGLALLTVLAIFSQLLSRQIFIESEEHEVMRALGMSQRQLFGLSLLRVGVVAVAAAIVALAIVVAASPLFPIGFMRQLEIAPGVRLDGIALSLGAAATIVLVLLAGLIPAWRASRTRSAAERTRVPGANKAANALARASFPPTSVAGVRMALEPGHGATATPVRTTIFGTSLALAALIASLSFGASLQRLVSTPRLSGWNFDAMVVADGGQAAGEKLRSEGIVRSFATGDNPDIKVAGLLINAWSFEPGSFGPSIVAGRRPRGTSEIALGTKTLRTLHLAIGKTVSVQFLGPNDVPLVARPMRIVGTVITPATFFSQGSEGNSATFSEEIVDNANIPGQPRGGSAAFVRFAPGISVGDGIERIRKQIPNTFILRRSASSDLANLQRISSLPSVLAGLLALVAAGTLAHTLISSVRRRRRDLAILRTLGFVRRQVRLTVVWQATTIIVISLAIGLPVGAVAGRWAWSVFVEQLGYVHFLIVPLLAVLLTIPAAILLANIIASIPARTAARMKPAVVLREE